MEVTPAELIKRKNYITKIKELEEHAALTYNSLLIDALEDLWKGKTNVLWDTIDSNLPDDVLILEIVNSYCEGTLKTEKRMENYVAKKRELLECSNSDVASILRSVFEDLPINKPNILWDMIDSNLPNKLLIIQALSMYRSDATKLIEKLEKYMTKKTEFLALADSTENSDLKNALEALSLNKHNILWDMLNTPLPDNLLIIHIVANYHNNVIGNEKRSKPA
jgi:hypothetical protein